MQYFIFIILYFVTSYFLFLIAKKLHEKNSVLAWVPIVRNYLITRLAYKPWYWWILMYIPVLNFYYDFMLWREIFKRFNRSPLYAILMLIPLVNLVGLILLALRFNIIDKASTAEK